MLLNDSFPASRSFFIYICSATLKWILRGEETFLRSVAFFLWTTLSFLRFCPAHSSCLSSPKLSSQFREIVCIVLRSTVCIDVWKLPRGNKLGWSYGSPLLRIADLGWPMSNILSVVILVSSFLVFSWEGKSNSCYSTLIGTGNPQIQSLLNYLNIFIKQQISRHNAKFGGDTYEEKRERQMNNVHWKTNLL